MLNLGHAAQVKDRLKDQLKRTVMRHVRTPGEDRTIAIVAAVGELAAEVGVALLNPELTASLLRHLADELDRKFASH